MWSVMKQIKVWKNGQSWMSHQTINGKPDPQLVALFGTATLPTAFTAMAEASRVMVELQLLNPDAEISEVTSEF